ncbi:LPXTG cell wall anchor domain-containing protein [Glycomyces terrestris]|uniref:LPXTG cell wall anchor domain-containing protein n=1 Tax=Glycomyces terrestris TaxID=2493553 RepID=A0A426US77_9ACTN|nr:LPXTG cell wall anchor domain-containing protein [Glycomyces terrestris]RRR96409.1 LPXTG cell wall anchor domain-containing protein [Glycomyces terrestris]
MASNRIPIRLAAAAAALLAAAAAAPAQAQAQDEHPYQPYLHADLAFTGVDPGGSVEVNPRFLQDAALPADTGAILVQFGGPARNGQTVDGLEVDAPYDNCFTGSSFFDDPRGRACFFTEFEDLPGEVFTFTGPATYTVDPDAPGPFEVCACAYTVQAVSADELDLYGVPWWDPDSPNLLGLTTADTWDGPGASDPEFGGDITIETTEHPYDLAVADVPVAGGAGDTVETAVEASNAGPAGALFQNMEPGSYTLRGQLPAGLELVSFDPDSAWECLDPADLEAEYDRAAAEGTALDRFDFACFTLSVEAGAELPLGLTVRIADAEATAGGLVEIDAVRDGGVPPLLDADLGDNTAVFDVEVDADATAPPKLPATGNETAAGLAAAAAAVLAGAALLALARRRVRG